jgi:hypothetical protein
VDGYDYLGSGPSATSGEPGSTMRGDLYARCTRCGDLLSLEPADGGQCACCALCKDPDAGRFGSTLGDAAIEIYGRR